MKCRFPGHPYAVVIILMAGVVGLAGCKSTPANSQAGLKPASTNAKSTAASKTTPLKLETTQQALANGGIQLTQTLNGFLYSVIWLHSDGRPDRTFYYSGSTLPVSMDEFTPDGHLIRKTLWYLGTTQPKRVEEYVSDREISRFTTYWPNGNLQTVSAANVQTPTGPANVVDDWYANGEPKSHSQKVVTQDSGGQQASYLQGRQQAWDQNGYLVTDDEFDHGVLVRDYLAAGN